MMRPRKKKTPAVAGKGSYKISPKNPNTEGIDGIEHYGKRIKVRAYVDDLVVFVSSMKDVRRACEIILEFCAWTNARINKGKTKLLGLGTWTLNQCPQAVVAQTVAASTGIPENLLQQIIQPRFNATHSSNPYFTTALSTITDLLNAGIFTSSTVSNHHATYNQLIANLRQPGRTEVAKPDLDWASIWRWVAKMKGRNAELVWDFNHNQLPTKMRLTSLRLSRNDQCPLCNGGQETDDHLMLLCSEKVDISLWLRIQLTKLGCQKPLKSTINGDVGNGPNKEKILTLIQFYIITVWTAQSQNLTPAKNEIQSLWSSLLHSKNSPQMSPSNP
ncbi:hypothetical protein DAPPUDRAFT_268351 [Daphnia pulex]|uniref:Reverse transcriptase zinc-binding domain-containing protein n=1 Tax=Daphnia pulex TaxID=6669 RepID=E9HXP4_DAPPU|nr:hypothetical protein DAPPUDRAFT_268351 [Daphnia pulex]|eukprot:EFX63486.1 hypothetical protein DAPPUDRAFT_268351 [Daphnia pulex]